MKLRMHSLCWLCLFLICLSVFPLHTQASATSYYMGHVTWNVEDGVATISGNGYIADYTCPWGLDKTTVTEVIIESGITSIGKGGFQDFINLEKVTIHEGVTFMDDFAFQNCRKLESISLPASLEWIGGKAFHGCTALKSVHLADLEAWCDVQLEDYNSSPFANFADLYIDGQLVTDLVIPEGCETILPSAFRGCRSLETVYFPDGLKEIGKDAFFQCYKLKRISLPGSVASIRSSAFNECVQLRTVMYRGRISQLRKLYISASSENALLNVRWQMSTSYVLLISTVIHLIGVGIPVGFVFLVLYIRRKRRGY